MEMKFFGLIETKLFNFLRISINWGQGGGSSVPPDPPLDPPLLYVVSCRCNAVILYCFKILDNLLKLLFFYKADTNG